MSHAISEMPAVAATVLFDTISSVRCHKREKFNSRSVIVGLAGQSPASVRIVKSIHILICIPFGHRCIQHHHSRPIMAEDNFM